VWGGGAEMYHYSFLALTVTYHIIGCVVWEGGCEREREREVITLF
jgi:hypothetical protein